MSSSPATVEDARIELYEIMQQDTEFEQKAQAALELGERYLGVDNAHLTQIDEDTELWKAIVSTDPPDGTFPPGLTTDYQTTYCRRVLDEGSSIALHDAPNQGWADDPAFEAHGLHCYHGTPIVLDEGTYGTVCFVSESPREAPFSESETLFAELIARLLEHELERKRNEEEITLRANSVTVLSRVLRHNLRNEMGIVRGRISMLLNELSDQHDSALDEGLFESIDRIIALSDKARKLESVVSTQFDREPISLDPLLDRLTTTVAADNPDASITIEGATDITIQAMSSLELALEELLQNAVTHAGDDPTVGIHVEAAPETIDLSVSDNGPGLPDQEREVLDEGTETPLIHGSGLGLWMVYWIVTTHDGSIDTTVTDEGTTVTVTLPRGSTQARTTEDQTVRALQRGRDRFEAVFEESFDAMVLVNDDREIIHANEHAGEILGHSRNDLLGLPLDEFAGESFDIGEVWLELQGTGTHEGEFPLVRADGTERIMEYSATADIVPGQHLIIARDITERREQRQALEETTQRLETVIKASPDPILAMDTEGVIEIWNSAAEDLLGYSEEEAVGNPISTLNLHTEEQQSVFAERVERALNGESFSGLEVERQTKGGDTVNLSISTAPIRDESGTVTGVMAVMKDITAVREREQELRETTRQLQTVLESVEAAVFIKDAEGRYQLMNKKAREMVGLEPEEDVVGLTDAELFPAEQAEQFRTDDQRVLESGESIEIEEEVPTQEGTRTHLTVKSPILDEEGVPTGVCAVSTDITARKEYEQIKRANERLEEFARIVSHDLRSPLNVARGHLELAQEEADGESEHLEAVDQAHERMAVLIEDMLTLSRQGDSVTDIESVELSGLVENCWETVETEAATLITDTDRKIRADRSRLQQLVENLMRNAVDHGGDAVTVRVGELHEESGFYIEDNGPGIPEDKRAQIFKAGYTTTDEGTGFGLNIVNEIVEAHGWRIRVMDGRDGGTRFEITGVESVDE